MHRNDDSKIRHIMHVVPKEARLECELLVGLLCHDPTSAHARCMTILRGHEMGRDDNYTA